MASVRSLDNALETGSIPPGWTTSKITDDQGRTQIPDNGRIIRNLIHGADTVMSHITHFYALAALDFVDVSYLGAPFSPTYTTSAIPPLIPGSVVMPNGNPVVSNYVESLVMRRKAHSMSAIFSGRHPIQNAIVPGGVSTLPTASDVRNFSLLLDQVRNFINTAYIPDVVSVATLGAPIGYTAYWLVGNAVPGNLLSYGEYPIQTGTNTERLLIRRTQVDSNALTITTDGANDPTGFLGNIREHVGYSYYKSPSKLNPKVGKTEPDVAKVGTSTRYSWLKAPRFGATNLACEVGPVARMVGTYLDATTGSMDDPVVSELAGSGGTVAPIYAGALSAGANLTYSLSGLVGTALSVVGTALGFAVGASALISILGRHACRALECKYVADAMADTGLLKAQGEAWLTELQANNLTSPVYVYAKLPTKPKNGAGWAEAPRGALCHWINIENKKIANYQCVVPSTWNHSPRDDNGVQGPAEQVLTGLTVSTAADDAIVTALRCLHVWDFCIACAVHIVKPDGSTIAKFEMGTDGSVTKLPHDAEI